MKTYTDVDAYMKSVPAKALPKVKELRALVKKAIPKGEEAIAYGMPTVRVGGENLIHFAAMKGHLGFYPAPSGVAAYEAQLVKQGIDYSKGCIRLSYAKPLPTALIAKIIAFRLKEVKKKVR